MGSLGKQLLSTISSDPETILIHVFDSDIPLQGQQNPFGLINAIIFEQYT